MRESLRDAHDEVPDLYPRSRSAEQAFLTVFFSG